MTTEKTTGEQKDTLKIFLAEEIEAARTRLNVLKPKIKEADFKQLNEDLNETSEILQEPTTDYNQLLILRREIGVIKGNAETLAFKPRWWKRISAAAWVAILVLPLLLYFTVLAILQGNNQANITDYAATQAMATEQAVISAEAGTPTPTLTAVP